MTETDNRLEKTFRSALASIHELVEPLAHDTSGEASRRVLEDALGVEVRDPWYVPSEAHDGPCDDRLLLATGGPAVRITGHLDTWHEPATGALEVQDWFLPWTAFDTTPEDDQALLAYARCFLFHW